VRDADNSPEQAESDRQGIAVFVSLFPAEGLIGFAIDAFAVERVGNKTFTTYTRENSSTGKVYSGRTSGKGTPEQQVKDRTNAPDHQQKTAEGYGPAEVEVRCDSRSRAATYR
jgi:hypothetical protein